MSKIKKYKIASLVFVLTTTLVLYVFNTYFCTGDCYVYAEDRYLGPLFIGTLGFSTSLFVLLFFSEQVFISWLKYIAWWAFLGTTFLVLSVNPYTSGVLSIDRRDTAIYSMVGLLIVTLVYAVVMNKKLKKNP